MVGSHAQIADVHRIEGVPYTVLPSSGKAPYGTPDRGGFTGWMRWSVDGDATAAQQWITADVRAFAQSVDARRARRARGGRERRRSSGSIVQPSGVCPARGWCRCATRCRSAGAARRTSRSATDADGRGAGKDAHLRPAHAQADRACASGEVDGARRPPTRCASTPGRSRWRRSSSRRSIRTQVTRVSEDAPVGGTVPPTLSLTLAGPVSFGAFTPGVARELHGLDDRDRDLDGRRRGAERRRPVDGGHGPPGQRRVLARRGRSQGWARSKTWSAPASNEGGARSSSSRPIGAERRRCARAATARR